MKKRLLTAIISTTLALSLMACGKEVANTTQPEIETIEENEPEEPSAGMANPWRDCTEEEAYQYTPNGFSAPKGATNIRWSMCEVEDDKVLPGTMVELDFDYDGLSFTARQQAVPGEEITDISGMYYDWTVIDDWTMNNWGGGNMPCRAMRYVGDEGYVDVILWFDIETGYAYSLSTQAKDLDGFDIQAIAEMMYDPAKQVGANAPEN